MIRDSTQVASPMGRPSYMVPRNAGSDAGERMLFEYANQLERHPRLVETIPRAVFML